MRAQDLTTRAYADDDADAVAALHNAWSEESGGHGGHTAAQIRAWMSDGQATRLLVAPDGELVAFAAVGSPPPDGRTIQIGGGVHPRFKGLGLGRDLLDWQLDRARERAAGSVRTDIPQADRATARLLTRAGFAPTRYWFHMEATTADAVAADPPAGIRIAGVGEVDRTALYRAQIETWADHFGFEGMTREWWDSYTFGYAQFRPELSFAALDGAEIAGFVLVYDEGGERRAHVSAVGTRRPWRGRGLASTLVTRALAACRAAGRETVTLSADAENPYGAVAIYERLGFATKATGVTYGRDL